MGWVLTFIGVITGEKTFTAFTLLMGYACWPPPFAAINRLRPWPHQTLSKSMAVHCTGIILHINQSLLQYVLIPDIGLHLCSTGTHTYIMQKHITYAHITWS